MNDFVVFSYVSRPEEDAEEDGEEEVVTASRHLHVKALELFAEIPLNESKHEEITKFTKFDSSQQNSPKSQITCLI